MPEVKYRQFPMLEDKYGKEQKRKNQFAGDPDFPICERVGWLVHIGTVVMSLIGSGLATGDQRTVFLCLRSSIGNFLCLRISMAKSEREKISSQATPISLYVNESVG